jgi:D-sedoheptulose 7-phosphate isomerase
MDFVNRYLKNVKKIAKKLAADSKSISDIVCLIEKTKFKEGRLFIIGVGGGAGHASHAVNDFRKIAGIEAYSPSDNVSELTARINDEGWDSCYSEWLKMSKLSSKDMLLIFSVGGGNKEFELSLNIVGALNLAKSLGCSIAGIVGRDGGETAKLANCCVIVPQVDNSLTTALTESYQAVIWHLIVSHPKLCPASMMWESVERKTQGTAL